MKILAIYIYFICNVFVLQGQAFVLERDNFVDKLDEDNLNSKEFTSTTQNDLDYVDFVAYVLNQSPTVCKDVLWRAATEVFLMNYTDPHAASVLLKKAAELNFEYTLECFEAMEAFKEGLVYGLIIGGNEKLQNRKRRDIVDWGRRVWNNVKGAPSELGLWALGHAQVGYNIYQTHRTGNVRHTLEGVGGFFGAAHGVPAGMIAGAPLGPVGVAVGGIIGGIVGGAAGSYAAGRLCGGPNCW